MFAGMVILDSNSTPNVDSDFKCHRNAAITEGGGVTATEKHIPCRSTFKRLGYMWEDVDFAKGLTHRNLRDFHKQSEDQVSYPSTDQIPEDKSVILPSNQGQHEELFERDRPGLAYQNICSIFQGVACQSDPRYELRSPSAVNYSKIIPAGDTFISSFSFIQQSLNMNNTLDINTNKPPLPVPLNRQSEYYFQSQYAFKTSEKTSSDSNQPRNKSAILINATTEPSLYVSVPVHASSTDILSVGQLPFSVTDSGQSVNGELLGIGPNILWQSGERHGCLSVTSDFRDNMPDSDMGSLDTEVTSSFLLDSRDSISTLSMTSGYENTTSILDQNWNDLLKKHEESLQNCPQENGIKSKIELMMIKLQMLQQKASLDDYYKTAVHFGMQLKKLKEENGFLKLGLPSQFPHPKVAFFLERLRMTIHNALQRTNAEYRQNKESPDCPQLFMSAQGTQLSREQLMQEKEQIQRQMTELQHRLGELQKQRLALEEQLNQNDLRLEKELEEQVLQGCTPSQLRLIGRVLEDLITSEHRAQVFLSPLQSVFRLQEQKQDLDLLFKEAATKVMMSQKLGDSLQTKVNENETQLLVLHEAKLAAISGSDFMSAEEVKATMKSVYTERKCLDRLAKKLQALSAASTQYLARMKEQHSQLKEELQKNLAQYENNLKENTLKYIELLEDRLHSCENTGLESIWEADLKTCHLLLRGLEHSELSNPKTEDLPPIPGPRQKVLPIIEVKSDSAVHTVLREFYSPEVNLKFTKDVCSEGTNLTEHCKFISEKLLSLEEQLQAATQNYDQNLTTSLEKEIHEVKATLQKMLLQLKGNDEDEEEEQLDEELFMA